MTTGAAIRPEASSPTRLASQELRASGESSRRRDLAARDQLTAQELQIAQLAAHGLSNRDIAQRLYLSHRTIGTTCTASSPNSGSPAAASSARPSQREQPRNSTPDRSDGAGGIARRMGPTWIEAGYEPVKAHQGNDARNRALTREDQPQLAAFRPGTFVRSQQLMKPAGIAELGAGQVHHDSRMPRMAASRRTARSWSTVVMSISGGAATTGTPFIIVRRYSASPGGLTAGARPKARPGTRAANLPSSTRLLSESAGV